MGEQGDDKNDRASSEHFSQGDSEDLKASEKSEESYSDKEDVPSSETILIRLLDYVILLPVKCINDNAGSSKKFALVSFLLLLVSFSNFYTVDDFIIILFSFS